MKTQLQLKKAWTFDLHTAISRSRCDFEEHIMQSYLDLHCLSLYVVGFGELLRLCVRLCESAWVRCSICLNRTDSVGQWITLRDAEWDSC